MTGLPDAAIPEDELVAARRLRRTIQRTLRRSLHVRHLDVGSCNGCDWEIAALLNPYHDVQRLGIDFVASPRHADLLLVTGIMTRNLEGGSPTDVRSDAGAAPRRSRRGVRDQRRRVCRQLCRARRDQRGPAGRCLRARLSAPPRGAHPWASSLRWDGWRRSALIQILERPKGRTRQHLEARTTAGG